MSRTKKNGHTNRLVDGVSANQVYAHIKKLVEVVPNFKVARPAAEVITVTSTQINGLALSISVDGETIKRYPYWWYQIDLNDKPLVFGKCAMHSQWRTTVTVAFELFREAVFLNT